MAQIDITRRRLLFCAPAVILTPGLLMKIKPRVAGFTGGDLVRMTNEFLRNMEFVNECASLGVGRVTVRTGMPVAAWRMLHEGILPHKSSVVQLDYTIRPSETRDDAVRRAVEEFKARA